MHNFSITRKLLQQKIILLVWLICWTMMSHAKEPPNLEIAKQSLRDYYDSGAYAKELSHVLVGARQYLVWRIKQQDLAQRKLAIVLDIDETALSNYSHLLKLNFGGSTEHIHQAEREATNSVIAPTLQLYKIAKAHQVAVFFLTGRAEEQRVVTEKNLRKAGYAHWDGLILRNDQYKHVSTSLYKAAMRKKLAVQGYTIVLNVGDQYSDFRGDYSGKIFKLPNPFYFIP